MAQNVFNIAGLQSALPKKFDLAYQTAFHERVGYESETRVHICLVPCLRTPPGEKQSGEQSRISWAYYPNVANDQ